MSKPKCRRGEERRDKLEHYAMMGFIVIVGIAMLVGEIVHNLRIQELLSQCIS